MFLHAVGIALWTGSLLPLAATIRQDDSDGLVALRRFSFAIPFVLAAIVLSGVVLAVVQVEHVGALWSTDYGRVLIAKLTVLAVVLVIAAWNRFVLTRRINRGNTTARRQLGRSDPHRSHAGARDLRARDYLAFYAPAACALGRGSRAVIFCTYILGRPLPT